MESVYNKIDDLREVPLTKRDFNTLAGTYGARKGGTHSYATFLHGATPSYRCAAQIDLDRFHGGEDHVLDWDDLIDEMFPEPDGRTPEEIRNDQLAMTLDKG